MTESDLMKALAKPFAASEVEWRLQYANEENGLAVPYIDSRAIQNRFDEVLGPFHWQNTFAMWHDKSQLCGISIYCEERREWITKTDGAANSDIEPIKGGLSDAFKRAAVLWGVGRHLYGMNGVWVKVEKKGKSTVIKQSEFPKLKAEYEKQSGLTSSPLPPKTSKSENPPVGSAGNMVPFPDLYTIQSVRASKSASGNSLNLEMTTGQGKIVKAYWRGEDPRITAGVKIKNVTLIEKKGAYGPYHMLEKFEFAA